MFTPSVSDASPRASRLEATSTSWTEVTPSPPSCSGIGAAKYPLCLTAAKLSKGKLAVAVVGGGARSRSRPRASRRARRGARRARFWLSAREACERSFRSVGVRRGRRASGRRGGGRRAASPPRDACAARTRPKRTVWSATWTARRARSRGARARRRRRGSRCSPSPARRTARGTSAAPGAEP